MNEFKQIAQFFLSTDKTDELYLSDKRARKARSQKGFFTQNTHQSFGFIEVIRTWNSVVDPVLSQVSLPLKYKKGVLIILVSHPVFAQEFRDKTSSIISDLKSRFKLFSELHQIKFVTGELPPTKSMKSKENLHKQLQEKLLKTMNKTHLLGKEEHENQKSCIRAQDFGYHPLDPEFQEFLNFFKNQIFPNIDDDEILKSLIKSYLDLQK